MHHRTVAVAQDRTGMRGPADDGYEEEEENDDDEEETDSGGGETVDATHHWTDGEAEAAPIEVRKWIAWRGYVPLKQQVWR